MKIGIIGAMDQEVALLRAQMSDVEELTLAGCEFYSGQLAGQQVVLTRSGIGKVAAAVAKIDGVSEVRDGEVETERIFKLADLVRTWGLVATALLLVTAILLISNTIRITIISRSREIQIMRLVGAKNSYIRGPFLLEGAWVGLLGAIAPSALIYFLYQIAYQSVAPSLATQNL